MENTRFNQPITNAHHHTAHPPMSDNTIYALSGGGAATVALALLYPLDNLRTRMQAASGQLPTSEGAQTNIRALKDKFTSARKYSSQAWFLDSFNDAEQHDFSASLATLEKIISDAETLQFENKCSTTTTTPTTTFGMVEKVIREEGVLGLYTGFSSGLLGMVVSWSAYYFTYRSVQVQRPFEFFEEHSPANDLLNGTIAGTITACLVNPLWVVNTRIKLRGKKQATKTSLFAELWSLIQNEGFSGLYQGLGPALVLVSNPALQFMCAEQFRRYLKVRYHMHSIGPLNEFFIGATSKLIATIVTYPYQVIKTLMQQKKNADDMLTITRKVYKEQGMSGFYNGMKVKMLQTVSNSALMFAFHKFFLQKIFLYVLQKKTNNLYIPGNATGNVPVVAMKDRQSYL